MALLTSDFMKVLLAVREAGVCGSCKMMILTLFLISVVQEEMFVPWVSLDFGGRRSEFSRLFYLSLSC